MPVAVGHNRHRVAQIEHLEHAGHRPRRAIVQRCHRGAENRCREGGGHLQVRRLGVDAEHGAAIDLGGNVQTRRGGADQSVFVRRLEFRLGWRGDFGGRRGELGVGRVAATRRVGDAAVAQGQLVHRHLPSRGGGFRKHLPSRGARYAHGVQAAGANAGAAAGDLQIHRLAQLQERAVHGAHDCARQIRFAEQKPLAQRVVGVFLVRWRFLHADMGPVRVQFVRQHLRQHGVNALAHFRMGHDGGDLVVRRDLHPHVEQRFFAFRNQRPQARCAMAGPNRHANRKGAARDHPSGDEAAARPLGGLGALARRVIHRTAPQGLCYRRKQPRA